MSGKGPVNAPESAHAAQPYSQNGRPLKAPAPLRPADVVYRYDGSLEGFLCCIFVCFANHELPFAIWPPEQACETLYPVHEILTDAAHAQRVQSAFRRLMGGPGLHLLQTGFLSGEPDKELALLRFVHLSFTEGPRALALLGHPDVAPIYAMEKAIGREVEHLMGFIRFQEADGMLGAVIHPKNFVLPLLQGHFCGRYPDETFLIYDAVHSAVLLHEHGKAAICALSAPLNLPPPDEKEQACQALWRRFYHTLSIEARENRPLRRQMCAKRFWADMTELKDEA